MVDELIGKSPDISIGRFYLFPGDQSKLDLRLVCKPVNHHC